MNRTDHEAWLLELTRIPTAAGREHRVIDWIKNWAADRRVHLEEDEAGNLTLRLAEPPRDSRIIYFTAHLDHPAMVVERTVGPGVFELSLRGGVMPDYLRGARVEIFDAADNSLPAVLREMTSPAGVPFPRYLAELETDSLDSIAVGDVARWALDEPHITDGLLHTNACDDLAAVAAALAAFDTILHKSAAGERIDDVRLLFTRAEEVGFIGAIAACRAGTIAQGAHVIALENSRAFDDSPIGGGPIVRVGDRLSTFSPTLTAACSKAAESVFGRPALPRASEKASEIKGRPWQRKLMAGGACEATVFCAFGHDATCLCLPLGNYHNMADLTSVQAGTNTTPPRLALEHIALADFHGLVDLLVECGRNLPHSSSIMDRIDSIWNQASWVLR